MTLQEEILMRQKQNGQVVGETPEQFANAKQNYNLFAQKPQPAKPVVAPVVETPQQTVQKPVEKPQESKASVTSHIDPFNPQSGIDALASLYTSPEQEEKYRKASVANQRILALGDALRHIGNIATTINYAPSQQFNQPVLEERQRYLQGKAIRDAANLKYLTYQQQKAAQDRAQRQWEATFNYNQAKDAANAQALRDYRNATIAEKARATDLANALGIRRADDAKVAKEAEQKETKRYHDITAGQRAQSLKMQQQRTTAYVNKLNKPTGGGSGVAPLDTPKGQITPNGRSYSNQLLQMFDYAKEKGYVKESDVSKRLRDMGFGKDQSDNVKRQMVMDLLRSNQDMGDYASSRLGWTYSGESAASNWDEYLEDDNEDWNDYLDE